MRKNLLSKIGELTPKIEVHLETERKLLPRLKFMGYVMLILSVASLTFAIAAPTETEVLAAEQTPSPRLQIAGLPLENDEDLLEFASLEVLNYYLISAVFAMVGVGCFFTVWRKRKTLFQSGE